MRSFHSIRRIRDAVRKWPFTSIYISVVVTLILALQVYEMWACRGS